MLSQRRVHADVGRCFFPHQLVYSRKPVRLRSAPTEDSEENAADKKPCSLNRRRKLEIV